MLSRAKPSDAVNVSLGVPSQAEQSHAMPRQAGPSDAVNVCLRGSVPSPAVPCHAKPRRAVLCPA